MVEGHQHTHEHQARDEGPVGNTEEGGMVWEGLLSEDVDRVGDQYEMWSL